MWPRLIWRGWNLRTLWETSMKTLQCGRADLARMADTERYEALLAHASMWPRLIWRGWPDHHSDGSDGSPLQCGRA